jgi:hypothetical protein
MMTPSDLVARWKHLHPVPEGPSFQRVDEIHPLDLYLGVDVTGDQLLMLLTRSEPRSSGQYRGLEVVSGHRSDGRWAMTVHLKERALLPLFAYICCDLIESSRELADGPGASAHIAARLTDWQRMFDRASKSLLDTNSLRGLAGELVFLKDIALHKYAVDAAIEGWVGPLRAEQDFIFDSELFEIKAIKSSADAVRISSLDQLDAGGGSLVLVLVTLDLAPSPEGGSFSVPELIDDVRLLLRGAADAQNLFETRLLLAGYVDRSEYRELRFTCSSKKSFRVQEGFPRLTRPSTPEGVVAASYDISIAACAPYEIDISL